MNDSANIYVTNLIYSLCNYKYFSVILFLFIASSIWLLVDISNSPNYRTLKWFFGANKGIMHIWRISITALFWGTLAICALLYDNKLAMKLGMKHSGSKLSAFLPYITIAAYIGIPVNVTFYLVDKMCMLLGYGKNAANVNYTKKTAMIHQRKKKPKYRNKNNER